MIDEKLDETMELSLDLVMSDEELAELDSLGESEEFALEAGVPAPNWGKQIEEKPDTYLQEIADVEFPDVVYVDGNELPIGGLQRYVMAGFDDAAPFTTLFLTHVKDAYDKDGVGVFDVVIRYPSPTVDPALLQAFKRNITVYISRLRAAAASTVPEFRIVFIEFAICDDKQHVLVRVARMNMERYKEHQAKNSRTNEAARMRRAAVAQLL